MVWASKGLLEGLDSSVIAKTTGYWCSRLIDHGDALLSGTIAVAVAALLLVTVWLCFHQLQQGKPFQTMAWTIFWKLRIAWLPHFKTPFT